MERRDRSSARCVVVDESGAVLLMDLALPDRRLWITPGGGIEAGESPRAAALRELAEETDHAATALGPVVWRRRVAFSIDGGDIVYDQDEHFFVYRCTRFEPRFVGYAPEDRERSWLQGFRWWHWHEIEASDERFAPSELAPLLRSLLEQGPPPAPLEIGR